MEIIEKEIIRDNKKDYASKGLGGTALGLAIGALALPLLNGNGFNLFGNNSKAVSQGGCALTCEDKIELTAAIYQGRITELNERFSDRQVLNSELFGLYKGQRDGFDTLAERISKLETSEAVNAAIEPWRSKVLQMHINGVAANSQAAINLEAERRACADGKIVNYVNSTFYPIEVANVEVSTASTAKQVYNPLCACNNICM